MGVVYRARQKSLNRIVALKVLLQAPLGEAADTQRFRNEAEMAAHLDHPAIVPVHEVGEHEGRLFLSMKLIEGGTLAEQLPCFQKEPRQAAALLAQVARAVHHAHQRGILHRDLKPSNILLDGEGRPHVTDFGLAKRVASPGRQPGEELTQSGALVGTPGYMAPEQTSGERGAVTTASDVYGLGAVLYALLTGRPPFQAETALDTLLQVREHEPQPPRALNPGVDRDLETVCLKCLQKEPHRRYESALALADDLRRFLDNEPVRARRSRLWERAWKWAGRRPAAAGLIGLAALAAVGLVAGLLWHNARLQEAAQREHQLAEAAGRERDAAEEERRWARQAVEDMYTQVAEQWLARQARLQPLQRDFLQKALRYYQRSSEGPGSGPGQRLEAAQAYRRVGDIQARLGAYRAAEQAYRQALAALREPAAALPGDPEPWDIQAAVYDGLGLVLADTHRYPEAEQALGEELRLVQRLVGAGPADPTQAEGLARCYTSLGKVYRLQGQPAKAEDSWRQAVALRRRLADDSPNDLRGQHRLAQAQHNLATALWDAQKSDEAEKTIAEAVDREERLVRAAPHEADYRQQLARSHLGLGLIRSGLGRWQKAGESLRRAADLQKQLAADFPDVPSYREDLALTYNALGNQLSDVGEAEEAYRAAIAEKERLRADFPDVTVYRQDLVDAYNNLTLLLRDQGRLPEAEQANRRAREHASGLVDEFPKVAAYSKGLARAHQRLAEVHLSARKLSQWAQECRRALEACPDEPDIQCGIAWMLATVPEAAYQDPSRAVELARKATRTDASQPYYWGTLGLAQYRTGDFTGAVASLTRARELRRGEENCQELFLLSMAQGRSGNRALAREWFNKAVRLMEQSKATDDDARRFRAEAAQVLGIKEPSPKKREETAPTK
jgi:tetratricopeptide (TPR) repeat protein